MGHHLLPASAHPSSLVRVLSRPVFALTALDVSLSRLSHCVQGGIDNIWIIKNFFL